MSKPKNPKRSRTLPRIPANGIDERLYDIRIRGLSKRYDREFEKLWELPNELIFIGSPGYLFKTTEDGVAIVGDFGKNMFGACRQIWGGTHGGTTSNFISEKLLQRVLIVMYDLAYRIRNRLADLPCDAEELRMALNYFDEKIAEQEEELKDEFEAGALTLKRREARARQVTQEPATHVIPQAKEAEEQERKLSRPVERGKFCDEVIAEIRRIKNLARVSGRSMAEIEQDNPKWAAWLIRRNLPHEDQDTFNSPSQWGPVVGYAKKVLAKIHGVTEHTITSWVKAYRKKE